MVRDAFQDGADPNSPGKNFTLLEVDSRERVDVDAILKTSGERVLLHVGLEVVLDEQLSELWLFSEDQGLEEVLKR